MWQFYSDDNAIRVAFTRIPTFCISIFTGSENSEHDGYEVLYFTQDEEAGIDHDDFDTYGMAHVNNLIQELATPHQWECSNLGR